MKAYLFSGIFILITVASVAQQWNGANNTTSEIDRNGNIRVNGLTFGRYGSAYNGDSNPFNIWADDGEREFMIFGSNASTLHLRLLDGNLKIGLNQVPNTVLYNNGNAQIGGSMSVGTSSIPTNRFQVGPNPAGYTGNDLVVSNNNGSFAIHNTYLWASRDIAIRPNGSVAIYANTAGNVGIGTTSPDQKLTVNGIVKAEEVQVVVDVPADYVFLPDYSLMPLDEVENYIQQNKHLPNVPSAEELKEKGWRLGEMNNKLLEKVEELTLYLIELKKENEELKTRIEKLENTQKQGDNK
jgi:hypothetical protein